MMQYLNNILKLLQDKDITNVKIGMAFNKSFQFFNDAELILKIANFEKSRKKVSKKLKFTYICLAQKRIEVFYYNETNAMSVIVSNNGKEIKGWQGFYNQKCTFIHNARIFLTFLSSKILKLLSKC